MGVVLAREGSGMTKSRRAMAVIGRVNLSLNNGLETRTFLLIGHTTENLNTTSKVLFPRLVPS